MSEKTCACLDTDARACYDLRYYGRSPVERGRAYAEHWYVMQETLTAAELDDGECECVCHDECPSTAQADGHFPVGAEQGAPRLLPGEHAS